MTFEYLENFFKRIYFYFLCECFVCKQVYAPCAGMLWKPEEGVRFPETTYLDGREPLCGGWELIPGPLKQ